MPEISQEEFEQFEAYKQLGSLDQLVAQRQGETISNAAIKYGFKKTVLEKLIKTLPSENNLVTSEDGVYVSTPDGDVELSKFAEDEWTEFLPSLKVESTDKKVVPHIRQAAESRETRKKDVSKKITDNYIMQQYGWALKTDSVN